METIKVTLCSARGECPAVAITKRGVSIDEEQNSVRLTHANGTISSRGSGAASCTRSERTATANMTVITESTITCPVCGAARHETMPLDVCVYIHRCTSFGTQLRVKPDVCCVFCSYGSVPCPPKQAENASRRPP
jgi:hypothetical protein